jgi:hypothetical protein
MPVGSWSQGEHTQSGATGGMVDSPNLLPLKNFFFNFFFILINFFWSVVALVQSLVRFTLGPALLMVLMSHMMIITSHKIVSTIILLGTLNFNLFI